MAEGGGDPGEAEAGRRPWAGDWRQTQRLEGSVRPVAGAPSRGPPGAVTARPTTGSGGSCVRDISHLDGRRGQGAPLGRSHRVPQPWGPQAR